MSSDFIAKEIFVQLQEHYKETKFRWIHISKIFKQYRIENGGKSY